MLLPSPAQWALSNEEVVTMSGLASLLVGLMVNLLLLAAGWGSLKTRVSRLESDNKSTKDALQAQLEALQSHREDTERHLDPVRDARARDELLERFARLEAKFDQLSALVIAHQKEKSR
jgi:cell division protein FtsB